MISKFYIKILIILIIIVTLLFPSISGINIVSPNLNNISNKIIYTSSKDTTKWTVMMYLAWDNSLQEYTEYIFSTLNNIEFHDYLNIIVLYDGKTNGDTSYHYFGKDGPINLNWIEKESNMGDPQTLKTFLKLTMKNYSAENYALFIISTHGSAWQGLGCDTNGTGSSENMDIITAPSYSKVLQEITNNGSEKIDVIGFDTCISGSIEIAYQIAPYVNFMITNEGNSFGFDDRVLSDEGKPTGWMYSIFLKELNENPYISPKDFAISVVNSFQPGNLTFKIFQIIRAPSWYPITVFKTDLAAINLSRMNEFKDSIQKLSENLTKNLDVYKNDIKDVRSNVREYGKLYRRFWWLPPRITYFLYIEPLGYDCIIDLYDFIEKLYNSIEVSEIKYNCKQLMEIINFSIVIEKSLPNDSSNGLSIYFPELKSQYDISIWNCIGSQKFKNIQTPYKTLKFSEDTKWYKFLESYLGI